VSAPTEALGLVPNWDRQPRERFDIRPHGTEARATRHRRRGERPCPACLRAENAAHAYRRAAASQVSTPTPSSAVPQADPRQVWITAAWRPQAGPGLQVLHSRMPEPDPEAEQ